MPIYTINPVFYVAGYLAGMAAVALTAVAFAGMFLRPMPVGYVRALCILAFVLLASSTTVNSGYARELFSALHSDNVYENMHFCVAAWLVQ